jgi:single-strand DNA-binding protein
MPAIQTTVIGNLTADPELSFSAGGAAMLKFSVAANRSWKNDKDEWENEVSYVDCIAWRQVAEDGAAVLEKGMPVVVTGRFEQRFWDDKETGQKRSKWQMTTDVIALDAKALESVVRKRKEEGSFGGNGGGRPQQSRGGGSGGAARAAASNRRPAPAQADDDETW